VVGRVAANAASRRPGRPHRETSARAFTPRPRRTPAYPSPWDHHTGTVIAKFHDERDILDGGL